MIDNIIDYIDKDEKIIDVWGRRNPKFEKHYEQSVIRVLADYGIGASENTDAKGKILGAGYEPYIMAFFIGLYANKRIPLIDDSEEVKILGQPLDKWGNLDSKKFRKAYPKEGYKNDCCLTVYFSVLKRIFSCHFRMYIKRNV